MPPDPPRLGVLRTLSLSTFINHHASKGPLLVKKNPPFKIPGYGPVQLQRNHHGDFCNQYMYYIYIICTFTDKIFKVHLLHLFFFLW